MKHSALRRAAGRKTSEQARKNPGRYWTIRAIPSASRRALPVQMTAVSAWAKTKNSTAPRPVPAGMGAVLFRAGEKGARGRQRAAVEAAQDVRKGGRQPLARRTSQWRRRRENGVHAASAAGSTRLHTPFSRTSARPSGVGQAYSQRQGTASAPSALRKPQSPSRHTGAWPLRSG